MGSCNSKNSVPVVQIKIHNINLKVIDDYNDDDYPEPISTDGQLYALHHLVKYNSQYWEEYGIHIDNVTDSYTPDNVHIKNLLVNVPHMSDVDITTQKYNIDFNDVHLSLTEGDPINGSQYALDGINYNITNPLYVTCIRKRWVDEYMPRIPKITSRDLEDTRRSLCVNPVNIYGGFPNLTSTVSPFQYSYYQSTISPYQYGLAPGTYTANSYLF